MPNGSLDRYIYSGDPGAAAALGWETLHEVAAGIARGLEYLHERCARRIVHRDIKPANILLMDNYEPLVGRHSDHLIYRVLLKKFVHASLKI